MRDRFVFAAAQPSQSADDIKLFELMIKLYRPSTMMKPDAYMLQRYYKICESIRQQVIKCDRGQCAPNLNDTVIVQPVLVGQASWPECVTISLPFEARNIKNAFEENGLKFKSEYAEENSYYVTYYYDPLELDLKEIEKIVKIVEAEIVDELDLKAIEEIVKIVEIVDYTQVWTWEKLFEVFEKKTNKFKDEIYDLFIAFINATLYQLRELVDWYDQETYSGHSPEEPTHTPEARNVNHNEAVLRSVKKDNGMDYRRKLCILLDVLALKPKSELLQAKKKVYPHVCSLFNDKLFVTQQQGTDFVAAAYEYCKNNGKLKDFTKKVEAVQAIFENCENAAETDIDQIQENHLKVRNLQEHFLLRLENYMDVVAWELRRRYDVSSNPRLLELCEWFPEAFLAKNERNAVLYASPNYGCIVLANLTLDFNPKQRINSAILNYKIEDRSIQKGIKKDIEKGCHLFFQITDRYSYKDPLKDSFNFEIKQEHEGDPGRALTNNQSKVLLFGQEVTLTVIRSSSETFLYALTFNDFLEPAPPPQEVTRQMEKLKLLPRRAASESEMNSLRRRL